MKILELTFKGKDSVNYENEIEVPDYIADLINDLQKQKKPDDKLFSVDSGDVSQFLKNSGNKDLSPKQFRTAIASKLIVEELLAMNVEKSWPEWKKIDAFNKANLAVAKKLNHQKNVGKNHDDQQKKMSEAIQLQTEKLKEKKDVAKTKIAELKEKIKKTDDKEKKTALKNKIKLLQSRLEAAEERLEKAKNKKSFKENTKNFSLGTSKSAYATPLIVFSFCKDVDLNPAKIYSKSLLEKYDWAKDVDSNYWRNYVKVD